MLYIDSSDKHLKCKKNDGTIVEFTNTLDDVQLLNLTDYTAFEVMPNSTSIAVGTIDNLTTIAYGSKIFSSTIHKMHIVSDQLPDNCDVVIDWGDGTIDNIKNGNYIAYSDGKYEVHHDYSSVAEKDENNQWKRFIVKIYGKDYSTFRHNQFKDNNLISRIFTEDLPIASHITNFASMCYGAYRLLKITIPTFSNIFSNAYNLSSLFGNCKNLTSVKGFANNKLRDDCYVTGTFYYCTKLVETDFCLPAGQDTLHTTFTACNSLPMDISELLPAEGFTSKKIYIHGLFTTARILTGTVPAHLLWDDESIEWDLTVKADALPFKNCSEEIRSQVPTSWGGTNEIIEAKLQLRKLGVNFNDYTAFEVFAHDYIINPGESQDLNGYVNSVIPIGSTHKFILRSNKNYIDNDVIVDWGDGSKSIISNQDYERVVVDNGEYNYYMTHTYNNGKYIVKILGKNYFSINSNFTAGGYYSENDNYNLMCRCLDYDLPIAPWLNNLSSYCCYAKALLNINIPSTIDLSDIINTANMFSNCINLRSVKGIKNRLLHTNSAVNMFINDISLSYSDMVLPNSVIYENGLSKFYRDCVNLAVDINSLIPNFFNPITLNIDSIFKYCGNLYGTVPSNKLWNNRNINWVNTSDAFTGCSESIRSQVPISWGGTASDDIINKSLEDRVAELEDIIKAFQSTSE